MTAPATVRPPAALLLALLVALAGLAPRLLRTPVRRPSPVLPVLSRPVVRLVAGGPAPVRREVPPVPAGPGAPCDCRTVWTRDLVLPALLVAEFGVGLLVGVLT